MTPADANSRAGDAARAYDDVPYGGGACRYAHPDRLATIGCLFGLDPAPVTRCRVLELGSAEGGNLIPMAFHLPESEFAGVEISETQVALGREAINALGLENIRLERADLRDVDASWGTFDYVIAHGVYSWVPADARRRVLEVACRNLRPGGIALIDYNTYPGWHAREATRNMMRYHAEQFTEPREQARAARELLDFVTDSLPERHAAFRAQLERERQIVRDARDAYLLHDHLEETNHPLYFHEFAERAAEAGLRYLGEAEFHTMLATSLPQEVQKRLDQLSPGGIRTQQYLDYLRNRSFRATLLCHAELEPNRFVEPGRLRPLLVGFDALPETTPVDLRPGRRVGFRTRRGGTIASPDPLLKAALDALSRAWPRAIPFDELAITAGRHAADKDSAASMLAGRLLYLYAQSAIELSTWQPDLTNTVSKRPRASVLARHQARLGHDATNQRHETVPLDPLARAVLALLDGETDRARIVNHISKQARAGQLAIPDDTKPAVAVRRCLDHLAAQALLVA